MNKLAVLIVLTLIAAGGFAQETAGPIETDEESLFGSTDSMFSEPLITDAEETSVDIASLLLVSERVEIGGRYSFSVQSSASWNDPATILENLGNPDSTSLSTSLSTRLFFDARPDKEFRVFGKMTASYPFATRLDDPSTPPDETRELQDVFHVEELFSDFNWNDTVFFRGGKQNMHWGVGYFYSPADLLSIAEIDPEDPEAEREGPVAVKANIPLGVNNLYLYALPAVADEPLEIGLAVKGELVIGAGEVGAGAIYQKDIAPAGMITVSASAGDFDLFAEGVVNYGSNRTFVVESADGVAAERVTDEFFFNATAGFRWSYSGSESDSTVSVMAQYLYNGEGYSDPSIITDTDNQPEIAALLGSEEISIRDLQSTGIHYVAGNLSWSDVFSSGINAGVFWMQNFTDMSALVTPSITRTIVNDVSVTLQFPMMFGEEGDELSRLGNSLSLGLSLSMGGGRF